MPEGEEQSWGKGLRTVKRAAEGWGAAQPQQQGKAVSVWNPSKRCGAEET